MSDVLTETVGHVRICTLNRPDAHNALSGAAATQLLEAYLEADADPHVRVIVTRAKGKSFCVGADFGDIDRFRGMGIGEVADDLFGRLRDRTLAEGFGDRWEDLGLNEVAWRIAQINTPMVASLQGGVAGAGLSYALLHHFRIASTEARFATALGALGLAMEVGMSVTLPHAIGTQRAMDLFLSGRKIDAAEALAMGLVLRVVPPEALEVETMAFAERLARNAPLAQRAAIEEFMSPLRKDLYERLALEWLNLSELFDTQDRREGMAALLERRAANFKGK
ncbi:MAG TPA: enoyl-CoA hydratase/isomerase family protein [Nevskiaceae bacterium]|nr:enoyl-CoA hydratase/isomerase family protein [Nevskiaceae bacterium]